MAALGVVMAAAMAALLLCSAGGICAQAVCREAVVTQQLLQEGFHRDLLLQVELGVTKEDVGGCTVAARTRLPPGIYVDPYELASLQRHNLTKYLHSNFGKREGPRDSHLLLKVCEYKDAWQLPVLMLVCIIPPLLVACLHCKHSSFKDNSLDGDLKKYFGATQGQNLESDAPDMDPDLVFEIRMMRKALLIPDAVDVEAPEYLAAELLVLLYMNPDPRCSHCFTATLPVHGRYHRPAENSSTVLVALKSPEILICCCDNHLSTECWKPSEVEAACLGRSSYPCQWYSVKHKPANEEFMQIPVGHRQHEFLVCVLTLLATVLCSSIILAAACRYGHFSLGICSEQK